jgi:hypothetical protein
VKDMHKHIIEDFFKKFPINPLNAEKIISEFNFSIKQNNSEILKQLSELELKPVKSEEDLLKIDALNKNLINLHINSFDNTEEIKAIKFNFAADLQSKLDELNLNVDKVTEFLNYKENPYKGKSFDDIIKSVKEENADFNLEDLNKDEQSKLINALQEEGLLERYVDSISSENSKQVINDLLKYYNSTDIETPANLEGIFQEVVNGSKDLLSKYNELKDSKSIEEYLKYQEEKTKEVNDKINLIKPDILKIHNYALELINNTLKNGSADKEIFKEGEKMVISEMDGLKNKYLINFKINDYKDLVDTINNIQPISDEITNLIIEAKQAYEEATISDILNSKNIPDSFKRIVKDSFPETETIENANIGTDNIGKIISDFNIIKNPSFKNVEDFIKTTSGDIKLINNDLYDFIRGFQLTLDSNPKSQILTIFDILQKEETSLKAASNISNYVSEGIRESNINQAISTLKLMQSVVRGMSSTEVTFGDPYGFIKSLQTFINKNNIKSEVGKLKTVTSDIAKLMDNDLTSMINKLEFVKELSKFNSTKIFNGEETIRKQLTKI